MTPTELRPSHAAAVALGVGTLVLGVVLGLVLSPVARWLQDVLEGTPLPVHGAVGVVADLPLTWSLPILSGAGLVGGVLLALVAESEMLRLTVADDHLEHRTDDREGWIERSDVAAVHRDGKDLVLLGDGGRPRARMAADDLNGSAIASTLRAHGWPWLDEDPYDADFEPWIHGRPGFSDVEQNLLRDRLDQRKDAAAVVRLDDELAACGLAVRERDGRLQVRRCGGDGEGRGTARRP
ncbi:hypothetical protein GCM10009718_09910 [Isoptericola halotolerans]|uniref:Uncharacterized protein n=1 Tax=Isoptericola halotolerans TaxID=300560 RepID=A0ABX2A0I9_9MICO|nr:hypothetical protein [Isoptericola halotolerans]NOV96086.1 hypothetical protein [Isoptericola halotolerans]